jgi:hypothetical protein
MGVTGTVTRNVSCDDFDAVQNHDGTFNSTTLGSYPLALTRLAGWPIANRRFASFYRGSGTSQKAIFFVIVRTFRDL